MADKSFGLKQVNLIGASGTPRIESPNNLNINATNVAISTDMSIGGQLSLGTGTSISSPATNVLALGTNNAERVRITSGGKVFLPGTQTDSDEAGRLDIYHTADDGINNPHIRLWGPANQDARIEFGSPTNTGEGGYIMYNDSDEGLYIGSRMGGYGEVNLCTGMNDGSPTSNIRLRVTSGGNVEIANGNLVFSTAGTGIDFSATDNGGTSTPSELLDDYEEGTFTPSFTAGTVSGGYTRQVGEYTKVGRLVTFILTVDGNGNLQGAAQAIEIGGLPFTSRNVAETGGAQFSYPGDFDTTNDRRLWVVAQNNTTLSYRNSSAANINGNAVNNVNSQIVLYGHYYTDS